MKKYIAILLCLSVLLIGLVACTTQNNTEEETTDTVDITDVSGDDESDESEDEEMTEPVFDDDEDTDSKIQIDGDNIGTPGGSNAGGNWTNPH